MFRNTAKLVRYSFKDSRNFLSAERSQQWQLEVNVDDTYKRKKRNNVKIAVIGIIIVVLVSIVHFSMATIAWSLCNTYNYHKLDHEPARNCSYSLLAHPCNWVRGYGRIGLSIPNN
jgi:hypothetical protein